MGLGKTAQAILALRLLFHQGVIRQALVVCPKPLVHNWARELKMWAPDMPFEMFGGDPDRRRTTWLVSNCPLKLVNYETLTRDADLATDEQVRLRRGRARRGPADQEPGLEDGPGGAVDCSGRRSWALTGTPIENHPDDLVNLFAFVDPSRIPPETPPKRLADVHADCILRRTKDVVPVRHAAEDDPRPGTGADPRPARRVRPGRERRRRPPQRTGRHDHACSTSSSW